MLVVITDKISDSQGDDLKREAITLESQDIKVITVALGEESNKDELDILGPEQGDVIEANNTDGAKKTANKIMKKALEGQQHLSLSLPDSIPARRILWFLTLECAENIIRCDNLELLSQALTLEFSTKSYSVAFIIP